MKLQYALDLFSIEEVIGIVKEVEEVVDIIEIGTPMILHYGMEAVAKVRTAFPNLFIFADLKICDGGTYEADLAFNAGADMVSVMGFAHPETIKGVIASAKQHNKKSFVDMIRVENVLKTSQDYVGWGADYICIHNATDALDMQTTLRTLQDVSKAIQKEHVVFAGGINIDSIEAVSKCEPAIIVVGTSITKASSKKEMIVRLKQYMQ